MFALDALINTESLLTWKLIGIPSHGHCSPVSEVQTTQQQPTFSAPSQCADKIATKMLWVLLSWQVHEKQRWSKQSSWPQKSENLNNAKTDGNALPPVSAQPFAFRDCMFLIHAIQNHHKLWRLRHDFIFLRSQRLKSTKQGLVCNEGSEESTLPRPSPACRF